ncbi:MAG: hypothetical protein FWF22_03365 [Treponema sp.]|nr:hypothetical protein [Treponema sp.]
MQLTWSASNSATEYEIYRASDPNGEFVQITVTDGTSFSDKDLTDDTVYYYKIAARNDLGSSDQSDAINCKTPGDGDEFFWAADLTVSGRFYKTWAKLAVTGKYCIVYQEIEGYTANSPAVSDSSIKAIADEFDNKIYTSVTGVFGLPWNGKVPGRNKITLLLLNIQDGYTRPGNPYVGGFFHSAVVFDTGQYTNKRDMLYIDTWPSVLTTTAGRSTIFNVTAHEFQHLINFTRHWQNSQNEMELWIDEGLAESATYVYSGKLNNDRINYFRQDPYGTRVKGNNFYVWYDDWNDTLTKYSTDYLFFQWLRIQAGSSSSGSTSIYSDIIGSDKTDYNAVVDAYQRRVGRNYTDQRNAGWDSILMNWYAANMLCKSTGLYGYKGAINTLNVKPLETASSRLNMAPGEGVYTLIASGSSATPPKGSPYGDNIEYAGITNSSGRVTQILPPSSFAASASGNTYLLTLNSNAKSDISSKNSFEYGYVLADLNLLASLSRCFDDSTGSGQATGSGSSYDNGKKGSAGSSTGSSNRRNSSSGSQSRRNSGSSTAGNTVADDIDLYTQAVPPYVPFNVLPDLYEWDAARYFLDQFNAIPAAIPRGN